MRVTGWNANLEDHWDCLFKHWQILDDEQFIQKKTIHYLFREREKKSKIKPNMCFLKAIR